MAAKNHPITSLLGWENACLASWCKVVETLEKSSTRWISLSAEGRKEAPRDEFSLSLSLSLQRHGRVENTRRERARLLCSVPLWRLWRCVSGSRSLTVAMGQEMVSMVTGASEGCRNGTVSCIDCTLAARPWPSHSWRPLWIRVQRRDCVASELTLPVLVKLDRHPFFFLFCVSNVSFR